MKKTFLSRPLMAAILFCGAAALTPATAEAKQGVDQRQLECLAKGIYFEARGESRKGQEAVGAVILNRVASPHFPDTICDVIYEGSHRLNSCQFSFACDGQPETIRERDAFVEAKEIAANLVACTEDCRRKRVKAMPVLQATHYHASYVRPGWSKRIKRMGREGSHIFYFTQGR